MTGAELIAAERGRQVSGEYYDAAHDDKHDRSELAWAAIFYADPRDGDGNGLRIRLHRIKADGHVEQMTLETAAGLAHWHCEDTRARKSRVDQLVIAGALIAAEIDRLQRRAKT